MKTKTVQELHPRRFPGHRLLHERSLGGCIPAKLITIERGTFFNKTAWRLHEGWVLKGFAHPPYPRGDADAIVFEKVTPASEDGDYYQRLEPGYYWVHANAGNMHFIV